jgi:hypothetical protein
VTEQSQDAAPISDAKHSGDQFRWVFRPPGSWTQELDARSPTGNRPGLVRHDGGKRKMNLALDRATGDHVADAGFRGLSMGAPRDSSRSSLSIFKAS